MGAAAGVAGERMVSWRLAFRAFSLAAVLCLTTLQLPAAAFRDPDEGQERVRREERSVQQPQALSLKAAQAHKAPRMLPKTKMKPAEAEVLQRDLPDMAMLPNELPGAPKDEEAVVASLKKLLRQYPAWLGGMNAKQLRRGHVATVAGAYGLPGMVYVQFIQQHGGLDVEGSYVQFAVKLLDRRTVLMSAQAQLYPHIKVTQQALTRTKSIRTDAADAVGLDAARVTPEDEQHKIRFIDGQWRRVQEFRFPESDFKAVVDEDSDDSWAEDDRLFESATNDIHGRVQGKGVTFDPLATGTNLNLLDLPALSVATTGGSKMDTGTDGRFAFPSETAATNVTAALTGLWASVATQDVTDVNLSFNEPATPGQELSLVFNNTVTPTEQTIAQVNGYYHTSFIHDWVKTRLLSSLPAIDYMIPVKVNISSTCNAYYSGKTINFFKSGGGCINTAYDTVVYHEYGHFVDAMAGGITDGGLSEGWGDVLAAFATNQPIIGEGFRGAGTKIRTADNTYQYPASGTAEVHALGQAWAGFAWHLRQKLIASQGNTATGVGLAEYLIIPALTATNALNIPSAVEVVWMRDDDDGNLSNGTPHQADIFAAATMHSIPLPELDTTPPAPVNDLTATAGLMSVTLKWTATGDDGLVGTAKTYEIRYALTPITGDAAFQAATQVASEPAPKASGGAEQMVLSGLTSGTTYHFAMKVLDNKNNASPLSNGVSAAPTPGTVVFQETFETGAPGWTATGLWHASTARSKSPVTSYAYNNGTNYNTGVRNSGGAVSPVVNLSQATQAMVSFAHWAQTETNNGYDVRKLEVSTNGGTTWTLLKTFNNMGTQAAWIQDQVDLAAYVGQSIKLRFFFDTVDAIANDFEGWYIDDVKVTAAVPPSSSLTLLAPNGGEVWTVGSTQNITWSQPGAMTVKLEYSTNGGTTYPNVITASVVSTTGSYSWIVPDVVGTQLRVKVTSVGDATNTDASNANFEIKGASSGQKITGTILNVGGGPETPLAGVSVQVRDGPTVLQTLTTNAQGMYTTDFLKTDRCYDLVPSKLHYGFEPPQRQLCLSVGQLPPPANFNGTTHRVSFVDAFDRANATTLGPEWIVASGQFSIVSQEAQNAPGTANNLVVVRDMNGAKQTVGADFTLASGNSAPRFGVILRYHNAQNYEIAYRDVGGSSRLRISRVVNGQEIILAKMSIGNPTMHRPFHLEGRANGATLTLVCSWVDRNGKKQVRTLTATETGTTGMSGGTGLLMRSSRSHRADNFSATVE